MPRAKALNLPADLVLRADTGRAFRYRLIAPLRDDGTRNVAVRLVAHLARGGGRRTFLGAIEAGELRSRPEVAETPAARVLRAWLNRRALGVPGNDRLR